MKHTNSIVAAAIVLTLYCTPIPAQSGSTDTLRPPSVPSGIMVPAGHQLYLKASATGTQNYICLPSGWTFLGPQATLFLTFRWLTGEVRQQVATHFLSANPTEDGMPRPTWQSSLDTSAVWGKVLASSSDSAYVAAGAVPWLLLERAGSQTGPTGGSMLSQTTYIQRVHTSQGTVPTTACSVGNIALVPYAADYYFYQKAGK